MTIRTTATPRCSPMKMEIHHYGLHLEVTKEKKNIHRDMGHHQQTS